MEREQLVGPRFGVFRSDIYDGYVSALAVSGSTLYAGGNSRRRAATRPIASRNGAGAVGRPSVRGCQVKAKAEGGSYVSALAVSGSTLYAGGMFTTAGGHAANDIAQWNGSSWSALGSGVSEGDLYGPYVSALAVSGGTLYAGGNFTTAGGSAANYIAQWNGSSWSALGSGMTGGTPMGTAQICMRWRCRGAPLRGGLFHDGGRRGGRLTSRNGMGAVGRRSVRGFQAALKTAPLLQPSRMCLHWRFRGLGATSLREAISRWQAARCQDTWRGPFYACPHSPSGKPTRAPWLFPGHHPRRVTCFSKIPLAWIPGTGATSPMPCWMTGPIK